MEEIKCEFCAKLFKNKYVLKNHKQRAKFCIEIQKTKGNKVIEDFKECVYCSESFASNMLNRHIESCKTKRKKESNKDKERIKYLENELVKKDLIITELQIELKFIKEEHKEDRECILKMAKEPKTKVTNNTTNKILNLSPLDLSVERIKDVIQNEFDHNYGACGQKGIAEFAKTKLLTDDDGNLNYVCTDFDRKVFKYKDGTGEVRKDTKAKKLTNKLLKAGLIERNQNASEQWWVDEEGDVENEKKNFMTVKMAEINNIETDNSIFVKELSTITIP